jgi:mono/diheme cytochrome c family protein
MESKEARIVTDLEGAERQLFIRGKEIYDREGFCITCHQAEGEGLDGSGFPPLAGTEWASGSEERLIKLTLKGLLGPIDVLGKSYPGQVPMMPFEGLLDDDEMAAVLTYVRNAFGDKASAISPEKVKAIRSATRNRTDFYSPEELLKEHPDGAEVH